MSDERSDPVRYRIDDLVVEPGTRRVLRDGETVDLPKLSFDLLLALARAAPNVVEVDQLIRAVWGGAVVSDETVTQRVKMLRDALDVRGDKQHYVETVRSVGYRLRPDVIDANERPALPSTGSRRAGSWRGVGPAIIAIAAIVAVAYLLTDKQPAPDIKPGSVAVLPFLALSDGADDSYFADGLTEEILNSLAQLPELSVTARTSSFYFKGKDLPIPDIARRLGVAHVVEGSIRRSDDQLRITAQLVRAADGFHIWSESFDRRLSDGFAVQIDIAERIASALDVVLDQNARRTMRAYGLRSPEAFVAYQKGLEEFAAAHATAEFRPGLQVANRHFEQVMALAPHFADAYVMHSDYYSHVLITIASGFRPPDITAEIEAVAADAMLNDFNAAIRYAPNKRRRLNAEFDRALFMGEWQGIGERLERAFAEPGCLTPTWVDIAALPYGNVAASRAALVHKVGCDPLEFGGHLHLVRMYLWLTDFDALLAASQAGMSATDNAVFSVTPVLAYIGMGRLTDAEETVERRLTDELMKIRGQYYLAAINGDADDRRGLIDRFNQVQGWITPAELIQFHALAGDRTRANRLAAAVDARPFGHMVLAHAVLTCFCGAPFDLETTPVFAEILAESGLVWPPTTPIAWPLKSW